jgi:hypothetical protein
MEIPGNGIYERMRLFYLANVLLTVIFISSCAAKEDELPHQAILLFKDTNGLYCYDLETDSEKLMYKPEPAEFFTNDPVIFSGNKIALRIFKRKLYTKEEFYKRTKSSASRTFIYQTILLDTNTLHHRLTEKKIYDFFGDGNFLQRKTSYDPTGKIISEKDSLFVASSYSQSRNGIYFNTTFSRFDGISTIGNQTVYSFEGNLYNVDNKNKDTSLLLRSPVGFSRKLSCGFFCPVISPTGKSAVFIYAPDFTTPFDGENILMSIDLGSGNTAFLKSGMFRRLEFSNDGRFLLYNRYMENDIASNIYMLDLQTLKEKKIGEAEQAKWMK